jgi:hypothetical protein
VRRSAVDIAGTELGGDAIFDAALELHALRGHLAGRWVDRG